MSTSNFTSTGEYIYSLDSLLPCEVNYDSAQFQRLCRGYCLGKNQNYRLVKKLGEGGMGQTWLADELVRGESVQRVVCKLLSRELRGKERAIQEVRRVFDLTKDLNHRNICPLIGRFADPIFGDFLVMKFADCGTLEDWFKTQPNYQNGISLKTILPILRPIAKALDYAHSAGIIHRDVKPQNLMFMRTGTEFIPVLIDFGIAARVHVENFSPEMTTVTRTDTMSRSSSGTPLYMAPEQMQGEPQNGRTDQYALAMVLYEMLNGSIPFRGHNIIKISHEKLTFSPENPNFSMQVNAALSRALSCRPEERFDSCTEFICALELPPLPSHRNQVQKPQTLWQNIFSKFSGWKQK